MRFTGQLGPLLASVTVAAGVMMSSSASAATCTFGPGTAGENSLQTVMNGLLGSGALVAAGDCVAEGSDAVWQTVGVGAATLIVEIAGYANQNTFGIYDLANTGNTLQVYAGANDPFDRRTITFTQDGGDYDVTIARPNGNVVQSGTFSSTLFGFYLGTPQYSGETYFSNTTLNPDSVDHLYAYQGNGATFLNNSSVPNYLRGDSFSEQMYLLAWEDLYGGGDGDYQDMVLLTDFIVPVPLPPALLLLGSALAGLGLLRSRRRMSPCSFVQPA
jgi:hypothetical protein